MYIVNYLHLPTQRKLPEIAFHKKSHNKKLNAILQTISQNQDICCILQTDTWENASCLINAFNTMSIVKSTPLGFQKDNIMIEL